MQDVLTEHLSLTSHKIKGEKDVDRIESELGAIDGVRNVNVDVDRRSVEVDYDPTTVNSTLIESEFESLGYSLNS